MFSIDKLNRIREYIQQELNRNIQKKSELQNSAEKLSAETERKKEQLEEYKKKAAQKLKIIKTKQKTPYISNATVNKLEEMYGEIIGYIDEIDEKINELYDKLDEKTEKINEQLYEINDKINELSELIELIELIEDDSDYIIDESEDEELIHELEEEIKRIDSMDWI